MELVGACKRSLKNELISPVDIKCFYLQESAGKMLLHEPGDCVYISGGSSQVHLHSKATAKPVGST